MPSRAAETDSFAIIITTAAPHLSTTCLGRLARVNRALRAHRVPHKATLLRWCAAVVLAADYFPTACLCRLDRVSRRVHNSVLELVLRRRARSRAWALPARVPEDDVRRCGRRASWAQYLMLLEAPPAPPLLVVVVSDDAGPAALRESEARFLRAWAAQRRGAGVALPAPYDALDGLAVRDDLMYRLAIGRVLRVLRPSVLENVMRLAAWLVEQQGGSRRAFDAPAPLILFFRLQASHRHARAIRFACDLRNNIPKLAFRDGVFEKTDAQLDQISHAVWRTAEVVLSEARR